MRWLTELLQSWAAAFVLLLVVAIFVGDALARWWRATAWRRQRRR